MRNLFTYGFSLLALYLWIITWGWLVSIGLFLGYNLAGIIFDLTGKKNLVLATITVLGIIAFFVGAPIAAWISWSHFQGVALAGVLIVFLIAVVKESIQETRDQQEANRMWIDKQ